MGGLPSHLHNNKTNIIESHNIAKTVHHQHNMITGMSECDLKMFMRCQRKEKHLALREDESIRYYRNSVLRNKINKYAENNNKKISLYISIYTCTLKLDVKDLTAMDIFYSINYENIHHKKIGPLTEIDFNGCKDIQKNTEITNYPIEKLTLNNCPNIIAIKGLFLVRELNLCNCPDLKDISNLDSLETLKLVDCENVNNIGHLRRLKKLTINTKTYGIHLLKNLELLIISKKAYEDMYKEIIKLKKINYFLQVKICL